LLSPAAYFELIKYMYMYIHQENLLIENHDNDFITSDDIIRSYTA